MSAREEYESMVGGLLSNVWKREGDFLTVDPVELNTPLTAVLDAEQGSTRVDPEALPHDVKDLADCDWEELLAVVQQLIDRRDRERAHMMTVFFDYLFAHGPDPLAVLERLFIYARARKGGHTWGAKQSEIATLFGHSKQNWQHLEERLIEDLVTRWGRSEFVNAGGKSVAARLAYAKQRKGNTSRKLGRRAGDELPPLPAKERGDEPLSAQAKRRAAAMREEAERRRIAADVGCEPHEIDLRRIDPSDD